MKNIPCLYAIVQYSPFVETGEFANVGILLMAPEHRYFGFKLMTRKHARVTHFFEQLQPRVFRETMSILKEELTRAGALLRSRGYDSTSINRDVTLARYLFGEIVRPRETVVKFSDIRGVLAESPKAKLEELYAHYVERDFVTREYQEAVLERGLRRWLSSAGIVERFTRLEVGNDDYHATFPFVEQSGDRILKAVKPLHLGHAQANRILDHGGQWLFRVETLKRKALLPESVLFAAKGPDADGPRNNAYEEIMGRLRDAGVTVLPYENKKEIMEFVTAE